MNFRGQKIPPTALVLAVATVVILTGFAVLEVHKQRLPAYVLEQRPLSDFLVGTSMTNQTIGFPVLFEHSTNKCVTAAEVQDIRAKIPTLRMLPHVPIRIEILWHDFATVDLSGGSQAAKIVFRKVGSEWTSSGFHNGAHFCPPPKPTTAQLLVDYFDYVVRGGMKPHP